VVGGANTQVVFNDNGVANATAGFTFDKATNAVATSGNVTATGNVQAGNLITTGLLSVTGNVTGGNLVTAGNIDGANVNATGVVVATGNITGGNIDVGIGNANVGNIIVASTIYVNSADLATAIENSGTNAVGNIGSSSKYFNTLFATSTSALYADLAEMYQADADYESGTVLSFGGINEVTESTEYGDRKIAGVVSSQPAYSMNAGLQGPHVVALALSGRVPCRVTGAVERGDMMISAGNGMACACSAPKIGSVIGKALQDFDGVNGVIEIVVGRI
jgi:hypothetical protein